MHPVPQRLTVHAAAIRRIRPGLPVQHMGDRQNPAGNPSVVTSLRIPPQFRRRTVSPRHLNRTSQPNLLCESNFPHSESELPRKGNPKRVTTLAGWYYFGGARVTAVVEGNALADHYYALVDDYLDFDRPVPFSEGSEYYESALKKEDG